MEQITKSFAFLSASSITIGVVAIVSSVLVPWLWLQEMLKALGGAFIAVGLVAVAHEYIVARKHFSDYKLLADKICGVERVCGSDELKEMGFAALRSTDSLKAIVLGGSWLLEGPNRQTLEKLLGRAPGCVQVLIPDPCSTEIQARIKDEPNEKGTRGLFGLADNVNQWWELKKQYDYLAIKLYQNYPVAMVTIYDGWVYLGPVLHRKRNTENLIVVYKRPSKGADLYIEHFNSLFQDGKRVFELNEKYVQHVKDTIERIASDLALSQTSI
jgi:hypothetical protein